MHQRPARLRIAFGLIVGLSALTVTRSAHAIPIIAGSGETIDHVRDLPETIRGRVAKELGPGVAVGFRYQRFHIYWITFWTWGGEFVLYRGTQFWVPPSDQDWKDLLGGAGVADLRRPLFYTFPPGLVLISAVVAVAVLKPLLFPTLQERSLRLLKDKRYQEAWDLLGDKMRSSAKPGQSVDARAAYESAYEAAVQRLEDLGVSPEKADRDLRLLVRCHAPYLLPQPAET
jgi:hypothetical protein